MKKLLLFLCAGLALTSFGREITVKPDNGDHSAQAEDAAKPVTTLKLEPGPNDGQIAFATAGMLHRFHYLDLKFDAGVSSKFLDLYLNTLDPQHIHFLQSDLAEFEAYRSSLGELTMRQQDTTPAYVIFNRFMQRLEERTTYADQLLADPFTFTGDDRISLNRKDAPFPKDMTEAKQLWRDRVRYEYLQEKLNQEGREEMARRISSQHNPAALALVWDNAHDEIVKIIARRYSRVLRMFREWESDRVLEQYLTALAHVYDPHSDYFDKASLENFSNTMSLQLFGVGAVLMSEDGYCKIKELTPAGPAAKSKKLKPNDRIVAVAQGAHEPVDVVDMPLNKVVDMIRGPKGTEVRLTIIPADAGDSSSRVNVTLIRDKIKLEEQRAKSKIIELPGQNGRMTRLGVIDLSSFYASFPLMGDTNKTEVTSTTKDVDRLLTKLKREKVDGVILDLRYNGGGSLEEAINLTGLFIKQGPVVQIRGRHNDVQVDEDQDPAVQYDGPLIVLTSRFSASASEILAGALQDYGRALLVGDASTHGKGSVQSLDQLAQFIRIDPPLADPSALGAIKLTTKKFYRPSGSSTQLKGVVPDIILPSTHDYMELGEASLDNPLKWDPIPSAKYDKLDRVQPYLEELKKRSSVRVNSEEDFTYVRQDIEQVKKLMADKSASLNELQRLKEKEADDARVKAREQELKSRKQPDETVYEIGLKDVDLPGLPPPVGKTNSALATATKPGSAVVPADSTNAVASASVAVSKVLDGTVEKGANREDNPTGDPNDDSFDDKIPTVDVDLEEAERIMVDYISLLPKDALAVKQETSSIR